MPRRARVRIAGVPLHLIQRGNNRCACFFAEGDYLYYLHHLGLPAERFRCAIHAYVLMTNHVHLLLTPADANGASLMMRHLGQRYVQYINRTYRRSGSLWEGRFRSSLVQTEAYLLRCHQYIELNPVRARMVATPDDYRWSSFAANAKGRTNLLLTPHAEYLQLGADAPARQIAYRDLFRTELDDIDLAEIRKSTNSGYALGAERFVEAIERLTGRRARQGKSGRPTTAESAETMQQEPLFY
ncbi:MAG: transposase [Betaproteobacteria bacterium RIFCSPLOWO2_02_FULL_62_17]|nr:MAG: transposase [Betaproteobacteria bacterium RIFCSPLOWO2_02_FULL_62_17]